MSVPQTLADTDAVDLATSNTSCRILVVSPSLSQATGLISRIQAFGEIIASTPEEANEGKKDLLSPDLVKIPWTIENKYYSADVHFAAHPMRGLAPYLLQNVPAVIFVWASDEAYKHHIERISRDLGGHEPEVSLAVRVNPLPGVLASEPADDVERDEDNASIDGYVSGFGFEYVDATLDVDDPQERSGYQEEDESDGIPNLPRVLDALSTIMWPSMKAQAKNSKHVKGGLQRDPSLFEWGKEGTHDHSSSLVDDLVENSSSQLSAQARRKQVEMEELTRWLENDVHDSDLEDPWKLAARSDAMVSSPTGDDGGFSDKFPASSEQAGSSIPPDFAKFDDDFTVFVSAPINTAVEGSKAGSGRSTPEGGGDGQDGLKPSGGLRSYNTLGSVSDFGGSEDGKESKHVISDDEDDDLPTRDEILEASSRIFGKKSKSRPAAGFRQIHDTEPHMRLGEAELEGEEYDMAPFDLSRVLGSLQQMKEEISGMENEDERRKAAARVALGLVYGLEAEGDLN